MKKVINIIIIIIAGIILFSCNKDFLEMYPKDKLQTSRKINCKTV